MRRIIETIESASHIVLGINDRNLSFVYPYNKRSHFSLANDKTLTKKILEENDIPVPETYSVIEYFWQINEKLEELTDHSSFVIKPAHGSMGKGILILRRNENKLMVNPSGEIFDRNKLQRHIAGILNGAYSFTNSDKVLIEYCIQPDKSFLEIYPGGIPDIRIITFQDQALMAMLRMPTHVSKGKANLHQGAIGIGIDLKTGILRQGFYRNGYIDNHPDSGNSFTGKSIPHWEKVLEITHHTASIIPLKYLGVDIILDQKAGPLIIEINARPGLQIQNANNTGLREILNKSR